MARRTSTQEKPAAAVVCPHLGFAEDRASREDVANRQHRCFFTRPPQRVDLDHQRHFCLTSASGDCPWLTVDELPTAILSEDPGVRKQQQVEQTFDTVGHGVKTAVQTSAPIVKWTLWSMARGARFGAVAIWSWLAQARASRAAAPAVAGEPAPVEAVHPPAAEAPYRILTPASSGTATTRQSGSGHWRRPVTEAARTVAALGAFAAVLFWLSDLYRNWLPAETARQGFWPTFQIPALPLTFTVQHLNLTFDLGVAIAPVIGAIWAWYTFHLLAQEEPSFFISVLLTVGGVLALGQYVGGPPVAVQIGVLCQALPSLFVLVARAAREPAQRLIGWSS